MTQSPFSELLRRRHKMHSFLQGLQLIVNSYGISGSVAVTMQHIYKRKLLQSEFDELATGLILFEATKTKPNQLTFDLNKLKVKITN